MSPLVLLSKPGCHLCEAMKALALPVLQELGLQLEERDVRDEPEEFRLYGSEIPVLLWKGAVVARGRTTAEAVRARIRELSTARS